jgi:hypothetical protein
MRRAFLVVVLLAGSTTGYATKDRRAEETAAAGKAVAAQVDALGGELDAALFTDDARFAGPGASETGLPPADLVKALAGDHTIVGKKLSGLTALWVQVGSVFVTFDVALTLEQADGKRVTRALRASEMIVLRDDAWRVAAGMWSEGVPDKQAHALAQKLQLASPGEVVGEIEQNGEVLDAFTYALEDKLIASRADLTFIGSAPGERGKGGKVLAKSWNKSWGHGKAKLISGRVSAARDFEWIVAHVVLRKPATKDAVAYEIPFRVMFVYERATDGGLELIHAHFQVLR